MINPVIVINKMTAFPHLFAPVSFLLGVTAFAVAVTDFSSRRFHRECRYTHAANHRQVKYELR